MSDKIDIPISNEVTNESGNNAKRTRFFKKFLYLIGALVILCLLIAAGLSYINSQLTVYDPNMQLPFEQSGLPQLTDYSNGHQWEQHSNAAQYYLCNQIAYTILSTADNPNDVHTYRWWKNYIDQTYHNKNLPNILDVSIFNIVQYALYNNGQPFVEPPQTNNQVNEQAPTTDSNQAIPAPSANTQQSSANSTNNTKPVIVQKLEQILGITMYMDPNDNNLWNSMPDSLALPAVFCSYGNTPPPGVISVHVASDSGADTVNLTPIKNVLNAFFPGQEQAVEQLMVKAADVMRHPDQYDEGEYDTTLNGTEISVTGGVPSVIIGQHEKAASLMVNIYLPDDKQ